MGPEELATEEGPEVEDLRPVVPSAMPNRQKGQSLGFPSCTFFKLSLLGGLIVDPALPLEPPPPHLCPNTHPNQHGELS